MLQKVFAINQSVKKGLHIQKTADSSPKGLKISLVTAVFLLCLSFILPSNKAIGQNVSLSFTKGYLGTQQSAVQNTTSIKNFSTLGIARLSFSQAYSGTFGGTQGNDLAGIITLYLNSGRVISLNGALNWRETSAGNTVEVFGLIFNAGQNASITYGANQTYNIVGGNTNGTSTSLGLAAYACSFVFTDGENRSGNAATTNIIANINAELANSPQPSAISLSSPSVIEGQNLVYNVTLSTPTSAGKPQVYTFSTSGSASKGNDYNATFTFSNGVVNNGDGTITVPGSVSSFTVTINTIDDNVIESIENILLAIGSKSAIGSIADNDAASIGQCDPNSLYDNIISGYHQSIAMKSDGSFSVWGNLMANNGSSNILVPQNFNVTNYANLVGTPLKSAIAGKAGSTASQAVLLTTDGLFAWGGEGNIFHTSLTTSSTFAKIVTPTGGDANTKLPTGVSPGAVRMMVAFFETLVLVTNSGNVWVLTQTNGELRGIGTASSATTSWTKVKIDGSTDLNNVISVRGMVDDLAYNGLMALTADGKAYVWGKTVYLGDGAAAVSKSYATLMILPTEFSINNLPKMIAVTGGNKTAPTTCNNTFYILSNGGNLYALGDNQKRQCGDFTTTERKTWVQVKMNSTTVFSNVNFISAMESDPSDPAVVAITKSGGLYTWGFNPKNMIGRPTVDISYDPGIPSGFLSGTDKAISAEMGGHTLVYIKEGSSQFCYVGHRINGSMGDNTTTDFTEASFNCSSTPSLSICGSVPVAASTITSVINANPTSIAANGTATSTITVRLKQANGTNLTSTGGTIVISTDKGSINAVTDNNDGTYAATLTSSAIIEMATLSYTLNGAAGTNTASVNFINATNPIITTTGSLSAFATCAGTASAAQSFTISANNLTANITIAAPTGFEVSTSSGSGFLSSITINQSGGSVSSTTVYARLSASATGTPSGNITCTSTGATTQNISASGTANAATSIATHPVNRTVAETNNTTFSVSVSGVGLSYQWYSNTINSNSGGTLIGSATSSSYTLSQSVAGTYYYYVIVTGTCSSATSNAASLTVISASSPNILVSSGTLTPFTACAGTASAEQSFTVGGSNLTAGINIAAPTDYEITTTSGSNYNSSITLALSSGTVISTTTIYIRLKSNASDLASGDVACTSTGAAQQDIATGSATVNALPTITLGTVNNIITSATSFDLPYTATTGSPDQYSIATAPTAMAGFSAVNNATLGSSPISIIVPASSVNTYNFNITLNNTTTGCVSSATPFTVQVVKANSTITVTGLTSFTYNGSAQGPSTNTNTGSTGSVTYSYSGVSPTVYTASATAPTAAGTYQVIATLASDANYDGAISVAYAFEIVKANSTIVVTGLTSFNYNGSAQGPSTNTKTGSTGAVTYSYSGVSPTVYTASSTAPASEGTYQLIASLAEDANYNSAVSAPYAFNIINNISTITVTGLTSFTYNGSAQGPSTNTKTGSTGAVTYSYSGLSPTVYTATSTAPTSVGTYQVIAMLASDANYPAASSVAYAFTIIPAPSTIVVTGATSFSYNGNSQGPSTSTKTGSTGAVTYTYQGTGTTLYGPSTVAPTNAGAYELVANLAADANFNGTSSAAYAFTIQKINPTVVLADIVKIMGDPSFTITATSNSNGAIVYSMGTAAVATITGNTVSLVGLGISTITVTQAESINYNAGSTTATLTVTPSAPVTNNGTYVLGSSGNPSNTNLLITPVAGATINFYPAATGGSPSNNQALPSTVGVYTFYVSQTINGIEGPRVAYVVTILPEIKTRNASYIIGGSKNPTNISSLVSFITSGSKPQWCDVAGNNCSNIAPALPTTAGVTIWCVKAIDTISGLASAPCIYDTVKMLTTASVMAITKLASKPLLNPDGTFTLQYKFTVSNLSSELLDSLQITDDLRSVFVSPVTYEIISLTAGAKLTANSSYNGSSQINLLGYPSKLLGLQSDTVLLVVKISPKGYSGSINNTALISGVSPISGRVGPVLSNDPTNYNNSGSSKPTLTILPLLDIIIPSGFSPNNDGINDNFAIIHPYNSSVSLEVFNRWGNIVYKNGNYNNEWYGKGVGNFLGQDLPAGTYYYVVNATDKSNNQVSNFVGYLTLKR